MTDLRRRFEQLDQVPVPNLRADIRTRPPGQPPSRFSWGRLGTAALAFAVAAAGIAFAARAFLGPPVGRSSAAPGGKIAFLRDGDIFVVESDGTGLSRLTDTEAHESSPAWSPDGTMIAYAVVTGGSREASEIRVMNADGSSVMRLTTELAGSDLPTWSDWPTWSPDGTRLAFGGFDQDHGYEIYITGLDGTGPRRLTDEADNGVDGAHMPAWSPDGKIAYYANRYDPATQTETQAIHVMDPDGTDQKQLTEGSAIDEAPAWSPDGTRIAFTRKVDGNSEIFIMNADGSGQRNLTSDPAVDGDPTWSPDGGTIAFGSNRDGIHGVYVMGADGTEVSRLTDHAGDPFWQPAVPEGPFVPSPEPTQEALGRPTTTIPVGGFPGEIAAAEGKVWAAVQDIEGPHNARLVRIDQATNEVRGTFPIPRPAWALAAAPGAVWAGGWAENGPNLWRIDPATGQVVAEFSFGHEVGSIAADPASAWIFYSESTDDQGPYDAYFLARIDAATNKVVAEIPLDSSYVDEISLAGGSVWLMQHHFEPGSDIERCGSVLRVDTATNRIVDEIPAGGLNIAAGPDAVWVTCRIHRNEFEARRIDPAMGSFTEPIALPPGGYGPVGVTPSGVWFTGYDPGERVVVFFLNGESHEVTSSVRVPHGLYTGSTFDPTTKTVWIAHTSKDGSAVRVDLEASS
jgi:dipeptidyl aminopeptidase/acylaminoacyl peptidase